MSKSPKRQWECEAKLIYSVIVAGKSATFADAKTKWLLEFKQNDEMPFDILRRLISEGRLRVVLQEIRTGNYTKLDTCFTMLAKTPIDFEHCTPADLEKIHGIGPKTSRFFIMWIRPDAKFAALDVHVLRWLNSMGVKAPRSTPAGGAVYARLEQAFLAEAERRGLTPRQLDLQIWEAGSTASDIATSTAVRSNNIPERNP
jgi:hypothetical protein